MASTSSAHLVSSVWPPEPIPPVGYLSRRALPIKRNDADPLTRQDVQYDLLDHIFSDPHNVFTSQSPGKPLATVNFRDLYVSALYNSSKCSKVLKDKMIETPAFALEFAKISLLTNVGRINTTMAFFPEMKTALRTYHPVPSLQKTDGNAQDAPRIKNCLKAALLPSEFKAVPPSTPEEILEKCRAGQRPPTSVVNLVFVLANHAAPLANIHFDSSLNFLDLFLPRPMSSVDRAKVFLWLIYHYLENPDGQNPFEDDYSRKHPGRVPLIHHLSEAEMLRENVDSQDEIDWGNKMSAQRNSFLQRLVAAQEAEKRGKNATTPSQESSSRRPRVSRVPPEEPREEQHFLHYVPPSREMQIASVASGSSTQEERPTLVERLVAEPPAQMHRFDSGSREERSMLQNAWHNVLTSDPLIDSDEENPDEYVRSDYTQRLSVLTRLRGKSLTPEDGNPAGEGESSRPNEGQ